MSASDQHLGREFVPPAGGFYKDHPDWICHCSCGAKSKVRFSEAKGCYVAAEKGWIWSDENKGWTCGQPGHTKGVNACVDPQHPSHELMRGSSGGSGESDDDEEDES